MKEFAKETTESAEVKTNSVEDIKIAPKSEISVEQADDIYYNLVEEEKTKEAEGSVSLTEEEKQSIREETGWSDEIIDSIESMKQYEIYKNADLHEVEINGRKCLVKNIDMDYVDPKTGMTNRELMEKGRSPIDAKTGEKIELHHMGQGFDSPFAELAENSEHGDGNHSTLHTKTEGSWRNDVEQKNQYQREKCQHWKMRAQEGV